LTELEFAGGYTHDPQFTPAEENPPEEVEPEEDAPEVGPVRDRALIVGDSQAQGSLGLEFERQLKSAGFDVFRYSQQGASGDTVYENFLKPNISTINPNLVVSIFGGNDVSVNNAKQALDKMIQACADNNAYLIAVGPSPGVEITNLADAQKKFPKYGIINTDFWLNTDTGKTYNAMRKSISQAIDETDAPNVFAYGIYTNADAGAIRVPPQPDGLHIVDGASAIVSKILELSDYEEDLPDPKPGIAASDVNDMLKQPEYYENMSIDNADATMAANIQGLKSVATRSNFPYRTQVDAAAEKYNIPAEMIIAVMGVESGFNPEANGPYIEKYKDNARGLMQFMSDTASDYGLKITDRLSKDPAKDERLDPNKIIDAGAKLLKDLYAKFGNWPQVLAGYNGGPGRQPTPLEWAVDNNVKQTKNYVKKAMILYHELGGSGYQ